ncbi:hypothetical protein [Stenotrophomonas sp. PS02289]|uniref:hypothetical protein n=1 Tax=Stenotrophomonas sp. PS02289 TaxID=2991422 RepID=UPI00249BE327|nr:hypothetical protein [Stenotrophomonas sp. PS02289]
MNNMDPRPTWKPSIVPTDEWTLNHTYSYLSGKSYTLYAHGSCVIWLGPEELPIEAYHARLRAVTQQEPDFRVQRHRNGDYLVTFKGGIGGVMSGELLRANLPVLRQEAFSQGFLPSEHIAVDQNDAETELELIAGLYVRAQLYRDVEALKVVAMVS